MAEHKHAMKQALEALEEVEQTLRKISAFQIYPKYYEAITALRAAIEQAEEQRPHYTWQYAKDYIASRQAEKQEPVAWGVPNTRPTEKAQFMMLLHSPDGCQYPEQLVPLYTAPPQREWQGLTKDEVETWKLPVSPTVYEFVQFIEAKLKEKNT